MDVTRGKLATKRTYQRTALGTAAMLVSLGALLALMLPFRAHLSIAIPALVFVLPAVVGVVVGGFLAGAIGAGAGFLVYDYFFLKPYNTLTVQSPQNWIALVVYVAVVLIVAQVVAQLTEAREEALGRTRESERLHELSQALIGDLTLAQLLSHIADAVQAVFAARWTALVLPTRGVGSIATPSAPSETLEVAATAGQTLDTEEVRSLTGGGSQTRSLGLVGGPEPRRVSVALVVENRPVGMLVLQDVALEDRDRNLLETFANQAALAVDRARLRDEALRLRLLEEIDRLRSALMGAASHDLRTPLASIKTAVSSLRDVESHLQPEDRVELLELIELQTDRLARLVTNLLDMTRIQAGALEVRPSVIAFDELVGEAEASLRGILDPARVVVDFPTDMPLLEIDHVLVGQVLANVLENAERLSPPDGIIRVGARASSTGARTMVEISVSDEGPGITGADREGVFEMFSQNSGGGRAGLGLAIAKAFVEAHGGRIWVDSDVTTGARVVFTVPGRALHSASV
jgi:two-component system, OmpR family, sensor histidine kinase KdpD